MRAGGETPPGDRPRQAAGAHTTMEPSPGERGLAPSLGPTLFAWAWRRRRQAVRARESACSGTTRVPSERTANALSPRSPPPRPPAWGWASGRSTFTGSAAGQRSASRRPAADRPRHFAVGGSVRTPPIRGSFTPGRPTRVAPVRRKRSSRPFWRARGSQSLRARACPGRDAKKWSTARRRARRASWGDTGTPRTTAARSPAGTRATDGEVRVRWGRDGSCQEGRGKGPGPVAREPVRAGGAREQVRLARRWRQVAPPRLLHGHDADASAAHFTARFARGRAERRPDSLAQDDVRTSIMSCTRSSGVSPGSTTTRRRRGAARAASTYSAPTRISRSRCSTATMAPDGSARSFISLGRWPFRPDATCPSRSER